MWGGGGIKGGKCLILSRERHLSQSKLESRLPLSGELKGEPSSD